MTDNGYVMLSIKPLTKERFKTFGEYKDTADSILNRLMDIAEKKQK